MSMKPQVPQCNSLSCAAASVACLLRLPSEASPAVRQVGQSSISVADGEGQSSEVSCADTWCSLQILFV
jgi:hypothetical protein